MIVPRRVALRSLFALAVTAFTGGALGRVAGRPPSGAAPDGTDPHAFDEMYRGRRVIGFSGPGGAPVALVDGRPLHLMRCADGGYVTPIDHYESCPTPLAAVRAAVDELGGARLSPLAAAHGVPTDPTGGSPRGVHA
ncbi:MULTISPECIES: tyrosinase family oxidase copper chaperone [Streptomyces]|uniref:Tyrosinase co-factor protein n=1 Tax=Streptomyces venezuelae (strain ATCC 10712 / CBS 650.69 / DSM 40230 / JCM 4526 / NBRC 13096 / PD 04745) TaxID=953739 RepID=F2RLI0_STRVP|nr:tyrosinase family oxidase copper chaperone [Streptomyces venezuelae]APE23605.1 tyrosinase co-factor protein [Streptomyces venezuelae]QES00978.1 tyrosinase co-factor protein [Streptomyces venezuelae ATCC 10712]CCA57939.1 tyrosinase co-factor protein [Streptomyces venezuelae ATCC 10712]